MTRGFEASRHMFTKDMSSWVHDVRLVEGDLDVDGQLDLFEQELAVLVVTGRLVVRGHYGDRDDRESGTFVLGSMQADSVITAGWLNVAGSLLVRGGLIGDYNDCSATIGGQATARFLHTEEHWFSFGGDVHVDAVLGPARGEWPASTTLQELPASRYPEVLVPEVFYLDGAKGEPFDRTALSEEEIDDLDDLLLLDRRELLGRTRRGETVLA